MDMDHGSSNTTTQPTCKISMLWNWYTVDSCFIARSWHVRSKAMFAGSCIGVLLLVMALELVRRGQREYDRYIARQCAAAASGSQTALNSSSEGSKVTGTVHSSGTTGIAPRPTFLQQIIRAFIYMVQFGMAYFVMLLAMYYNGYIIICILLGAFLGNYAFGFDNLILTGRQETGTSCC